MAENSQDYIQPESQLAEQLKDLQSRVESAGVATPESEIVDAIKQMKQAGAVSQGSVLQLMMARSQPHLVQSMVSANYSLSPISDDRIKLVNNQRKQTALTRAVNKNRVSPPSPVVRPISQPTNADLALVNILTGKVAIDMTTAQQYQLLEESQEKLIRFLIQKLREKDEKTALQLYAAYRYKDPSLFQKFAQLDAGLLQSYGKFVDLMQDTIKGTVPISQLPLSSPKDLHELRSRI